ncbi:MAG: hypothetical protein WCT36_03810 [Candidatus Gracilibacteria bacterium]
MKPSNFVTLAVICVLSIAIFMFFGYSIGRYVQMDAMRGGIEFIPDINLGVCAVDINEITDYELRGSVGEKHVRVRYKGKVVIPDVTRNFMIQY